MKFKTASSKESFSERGVLKVIDAILLRKRGYTAKMPSRGSAVVLLLSGGLDSIALWYALMKNHHVRVYPLFLVGWRQTTRGKKSWESVQFFSKIFKKQFPTQFRSVKTQTLNQTFSYRDIKNKSKILMDLPSIVPNMLINTTTNNYHFCLVNNPARLSLYTIKAFEYALSLRYGDEQAISTIVIGILSTDGEYVREASLSSIRSLNLSICLQTGDYSWTVLTPQEKNLHFYYSKSDLVKLLSVNHIPIYKSWSCNKDGSMHCGGCYNCISRRQAFKDNDLHDNTLYKTDNISSRASLLSSASSMTKMVITQLSHLVPHHTKPINKTPKNETYEALRLCPDVSTLCYQNKIYMINSENNLAIYNEVGRDIINRIKITRLITFENLYKYIASAYSGDKKKIKNDLVLFIKKNIDGNFIIGDKK